MKKIYTRISLLVLFCAIAFTKNYAQVNLPYTLSFSSGYWADGVAKDGDGGTANINGLDIQIYAADASYNKLINTTMQWWNNDDFYVSGTPTYNAITAMPDPEPFPDGGVPAIVLKSSNTSTNFSLQSIQLYDWGGASPLTMATYDNGSLIGSIEVAFDQVNWTVKTISQSDELTPFLFNNIDEIRFYPSASSGLSDIYLSLNNIALAAPSSTLPVRLTRFDASLVNGQILLKWQTATEINSRKFTIQHSTNAVNWQTIGMVKAAGQSSVVQHYQFLHTTPQQGANYYRLIQADHDGKEAYSKIITINLAAAKTQFSVYPNPVVNGQLNLKLEIAATVLVYNSAGHLLLKKELLPGVHQMNLKNFPKGMYSVTAGNETASFVIQ